MLFIQVRNHTASHDIRSQYQDSSLYLSFAHAVITVSDTSCQAADNSSMRKRDPQESTHFRSGNRLYCINGKWFFQTREADHGPYPSKEAAQVELQRYVEEMNYFDAIGPEQARLTTKQNNTDYASSSLVDKD